MTGGILRGITTARTFSLPNAVQPSARVTALSIPSPATKMVLLETHLAEIIAYAHDDGVVHLGVEVSSVAGFIPARYRLAGSSTGAPMVPIFVRVND